MAHMLVGSRGMSLKQPLFSMNHNANPLSPFGQMGGAQEGSKLKEIRARIKSVKSIEKITKTMKMIASSRLKGAQNRMEKNKPFFEGATKIFTILPTEPAKKSLFIAVTADRGLCGAINSSIAKATKNLIQQLPQTSDTSYRIVCMGDKGGQLLVRDQGKNISFSFGELSRKPFNFEGAGYIASKIFAEEIFDSISVTFNKFVSAISYIQDTKNIPSANSLLEQKDLNDYEFEEDQRSWHSQDLVEFQLANTLYHAYVQNSAAELGARMAAMDSASRNASEMLKMLNINYNRGRQAAITTELTEIISGAAAVQ